MGSVILVRKLGRGELGHTITTPSERLPPWHGPTGPP
jgi:hypothetical protein